MTLAGFEISYLEDKPAFIQTCASWLFGYWGCQMPGETLDKALAFCTSGAQKAEMPLILVAHEGDKPLGMAMLCAHDPDPEARPDLSPWLAGVYVHPFHRGKGIAQKLLLRLEKDVLLLGYETFYLITEEAAGLYKKMGWQEMEPITTIYGPGLLMQKALA